MTDLRQFIVRLGLVVVLSIVFVVTAIAAQFNVGDEAEASTSGGWYHVIIGGMGTGDMAGYYTVKLR